MCFQGAFNQVEMLSEFPVQALGVVSHYGQAAAFRRPSRAKRTNDDIPIRPYRVFYGLHIGLSLVFFGQEVEHRAIMPDIVRMGRQWRLNDIRTDPLNGFC